MWPHFLPKRYEYECDLKYARDYNARISFAEQKGMELGYEKGIEKGIKEGIEQGIEKGIEQGIEKGIELGIEQGVEKGIEQGIEVENLRIAKNLISMGLPVDSIIKATGLSADRLEQLRNEAED